MARFLLYKIGRSNRGKPKNDIGDIIDYRPDGYIWGRREENNLGFMKLDIPDLPYKNDYIMQNSAFQNPIDLTAPLISIETNPDGEIIAGKRFNVHFALSGINPNDEHQTINAIDLVIIDKAGSSTHEKRLGYNSITSEFEIN